MIETLGITEQGRTFDCEVAINCVALPSQAAGRFVVAVRDITDRKEKELQLRRFSAELERRVKERTRELEASRAFLAAILDSTADGIFVVDESGIIESVNRSAALLLGFDVEELLGKKITALLDEPSCDLFQEERSKIMDRK